MTTKYMEISIDVVVVYVLCCRTWKFLENIVPFLPDFFSSSHFFFLFSVDVYILFSFLAAYMFTFQLSLYCRSNLTDDHHQIFILIVDVIVVFAPFAMSATKLDRCGVAFCQKHVWSKVQIHHGFQSPNHFFLNSSIKLTIPLQFSDEWEIGSHNITEFFQIYEFWWNNFSSKLFAIIFSNII